ncbi:MAG: hypothetical protein H7138_19815 [Myxococcales bacterium]|nr:hypothetical protein [Myxococcales bacterium]
MANRLLLLLSLTVSLVATVGACGKQIGDSCNFASDCSPDGDRLCDPAPTSPGGYCTILGCDYSTCPDEAACVQFFTGSFSNRPCGEDADCGSLDEVCPLSGFCVARSSEVRYCMLKCSSDGDCREGYECRTRALMEANGGQPVLAPDLELDDNPQRFCAAKPPAAT